MFRKKSSTLSLIYINGVKKAAALTGIQRATHCGVTVCEKAQLLRRMHTHGGRINMGLYIEGGDTLWQTPVVT